MMFSSRLFSLSVLAVALFGASYTVAVTPLPDAGQSLRESQTPSLPKNTSPTASPLRIEDAVSATPSTSSTLIPIGRFKITGQTIFSEEVLLSLLQDFVGTKRTLAELESGVRRISEYYHQRGYPVARAYLPAQDIQNGVVTVAILEGRIAQVKMDNQARLDVEHASNYLSDIKTDEVVRSAPIDKALLLLLETPGVGNARATLQPGASVGSSDLLIELKPSALLSGQAALDNYGNRYTGQTRFTGAAYLNSPFKRGDQLSLNLVASEADLAYGRLAWQTPVGVSGLTLGAAYAGTRYRLGKEFADLDAHGSASIGSLIATYPLVRTTTSSFSGTLTWEHKHLLDYVDAVSPSTRANKTLKQWNIGLLGSHQDGLGYGGVTSGDVTFSIGRTSFDGDSDSTTLADAAHVQGGYKRLSYSVNRLQALTQRHSLSLQIDGQFADKNLASSEKFSIGGVNGVRAFAEGEASGDEGVLAHISWLMTCSDKVQTSFFYDVGRVKLNHSPFTSEANHRSLAGIGLGISATIAKASFKASMAWKAHGESLASPDKQPRLWLQASMPF